MPEQGNTIFEYFICLDLGSECGADGRPLPALLLFQDITTRIMFKMPIIGPVGSSMKGPSTTMDKCCTRGVHGGHPA